VESVERRGAAGLDLEHDDPAGTGRRLMQPSVPELGHFALALAVAFALALAALQMWGAWRRDARLIAAAPGLALGQFAALAAAFVALAWSAVTNDFSVLNIAENSHSLKPLLYKITGVWGDHEGSTLLWCLILAGCGAAVATFGRDLPAALRARVIGVLGLTACGFELFALLASNPFVRLWPPPLEGRDMNPLLQDPGLAFHPPILYCGYVGFAVPFAFAVAALLEGRVDAAWGRWVRPWTVGAWCFLTGGIALGSWWAYYDLGWGGFWFWDPVENASLLPWLTGTALLHSALVVEKREALKVWTVLLAIGTFSLSLSGTFLVRSGILNSVHAFANDPGRGVFILALLGLVIGGSLLLFAWRAGSLASTGVFAPISRESALMLNNLLLCSIAAVVITGTMYPLFADLLLGRKLSVGAPFFNAAVLPLAVPVFFAMPLGPMLPWKRARLLPAVLRLWWVAVAALGVGIAASLWTVAWLPAIALGAAAWLILGALADVAQRVHLLRIAPGSSLRRLIRLPRSSFGTTIAHAGLGVTIAGIAGMSQAQQKIVLLHPGESASLAGYEWRLDSLGDRQGPNYAARTATVTISRDGRTVVVLAPERRSFPVQGMTTTEAKISTNGFRDLYAVLGEERDGAAVMRLHWNPLAPWIWLGALVMALGGLVSLSDRRLRIGAPVRRIAPAAAAPVVPAE
jgi:cytochrome c-type biogenesis protein CcmF